MDLNIFIKSSAKKMTYADLRKRFCNNRNGVNANGLKEILSEIIKRPFVYALDEKLIIEVMDGSRSAKLIDKKCKPTGISYLVMTDKKNKKLDLCELDAWMLAIYKKQNHIENSPDPSIKVLEKLSIQTILKYFKEIFM